MKNGFVFSVLLIAGLLTYAASAQIQKVPRQSDIVTFGPNADRDIAMVTQYAKDITAGNTGQARRQLAANYRSYGPGVRDSANAEQWLAMWSERYKMQQDRKMTVYASLSTRVKEGPLKGDWVMLWFDYSALSVSEGKTITVPVQLTAKLDNGKIVQERIYYDGLSPLISLGWTVAPPQTAKK
ncbi:hypothetical protein GCM10023189_27210 [Nibrella saemangeumensis]|uniref:SnoaL-like domain-containing protein n=1 Tax=Nibrella saemangeumensis TaxID=1084526 RepID=A0ABP8MW59_9BACT